MNGRDKIIHEGTYQFERFPEGLKEDYVKIDERTFEDFVRESAEFARKVNYYDENDRLSGDWCAFFEEIYDYQEAKVRFSSLEELEKEASVSPHLGLFLTFLRLFGIFQKDLNSLSRKHIDFYYKDILGIKTVPPVPDQVTLFFEANKNIEKGVMIPSGTEFGAGVDDSGHPLIYKTDSDLLVNHAKIEKIEKCPQKNTEKYVVIASPMLNISDCSAKNVDLSDLALQFEKILKVEYTTESGWQQLKMIENGFSGEKLSSAWHISEEMKPFAPYSEDIHRMHIPVDTAALRIKVQGVSPRFDYSRLSVEISIRKTTDFKIKAGQTEYSGQTSDFYPLGLHPKKGDFFYVSEIFGKKLFGKNDILILNCDWERAEQPLSRIYRPYINPKLKSDLGDAELQSLPMYYDVDKDRLETDNPRVLFNSSHSGKCCLDYDLGYGIYPSLVQSVANYNIQHADDLQKFPQAPYIPKLKSISLDVVMNFNMRYPQPMEMFQVYGPEYRTIDSESDVVELFSRPNSIYLDISGVTEPSVISLYFNTVESGSGKDFQIGRNDYPEWFCRTRSGWTEMSREAIVKDTTANLTGSGIINVKIPSEALQDGKVYLKIVYPTEAFVAFPEIESVFTQVVNAECVTSSENLSHYDRGIPAGRISRTKVPIMGLKSVKQLFPSFGGRGVESEEHFYSRISERLRHKGRAWNVWDYERLILEKFPFVYKVKCLPCTDDTDASAVPGNVTILLFPDCTQVSQSDDLKPRLSLGQLESVRRYINGVSSTFADVTVMNAGYEEIKVTCSVRYREGLNDVSYYNDLLNRELIQYLAPWTAHTREIDFHKVLYKSQILYFIEKRPYVDYIEELKVELVPPESDLRKGAGNIAVEFDQPLAATVSTRLLTSAPKHVIYTKENE